MQFCRLRRLRRRYEQFFERWSVCCVHRLSCGWVSEHSWLPAVQWQSEWCHRNVSSRQRSEGLNFSTALLAADRLSLPFCFFLLFFGAFFAALVAALQMPGSRASGWIHIYNLTKYVTSVAWEQVRWSKMRLKISLSVKKEGAACCGITDLFSLSLDDASKKT